MNVPTIKTRVIDGLCGSHMRILEAGQGKAVVLAHSYLWSADMWIEQIKALAPYFHVIAPDLWGHGGSGPIPPSTQGLRDIARHHLDLMDVLGIDRFAFVGHSIGGMWGAELALMSPQRVDALALMNTFLGAEPTDTRHRYLSMLTAAEQARSVPEGMPDALVPLFFHPDTPTQKPHLVSRFKEGLSALQAEQIVHSTIPIGRMFVGRRDLMMDLASLPMPALVVTASGDASRPPFESEVMAMALDCNFIELPEAGHISPLETPDDVNRHLLDFLERSLSVPVGAKPKRAAPGVQA